MMQCFQHLLWVSKRSGRGASTPHGNYRPGCMVAVTGHQPGFMTGFHVYNLELLVDSHLDIRYDNFISPASFLSKGIL